MLRELADEFEISLSSVKRPIRQRQNVPTPSCKDRRDTTNEHA